MEGASYKAGSLGAKNRPACDSLWRMRSIVVALLLSTLALSGCKRKELEAALAEANKKLEATQAELGTEKGKNKTLTEENQTLQQKIAELEGQIAKLNTDIKVLEDQNADLARKAGATQEELKALRAEKAKRMAAWIELEEALETGKILSGVISGKVKGGLTVMVNSIRAFLPGSLVDTRPTKDLSPYENKTLEFKVIKLDRKRNNVVLSRRAVVEASMGEERAKLLETLTEGAIVHGVVKNITEYGAFVDLGGIDGLLHITDMAWRRVRHPSEVVTVGQELSAKVLKFDAEKNRVSLGIKQLGDDPWHGVSRRYPPSTRLFGKVTNIADYGAFVEIEPGIEGLVHVSEMDWTNKNVAPSKVVSLGDEVEVMVLEIDEDKRRISLGMKQCKANPWEEFSSNVHRGDRVKGPIKSITDFGVFVGLAQGIDGLVHLSDLSWHETGEAAVRNYKKGQEVEAIVLAIDVERERISLGIKQLDGDPFANYTSVNDRGALVNGKVKTVDPRGAEIQLNDDVTGYLRASEISRDRVEDARNALKEGDEVSAMIINVDRKTRSIQLSIKAKDNADEQQAMQKLSQSNERENAGTTSLGALLRAKLDNSDSK